MQLDRAEHGIAGPKRCVTRYVDQTGARHFRNHSVARRFRADESVCVRENRTDTFNLGGYERSPGIGYSDQERSSTSFDIFFRSEKPIDCGCRRVTDAETVGEIGEIGRASCRERVESREEGGDVKREGDSR